MTARFPFVVFGTYGAGTRSAGQGIHYGQSFQQQDLVAHFFFVVGFELGAAAPLETEAAPNTENKKGRRSPEDLAPEVIETLVAGATQTYPLKDLSNT